ncbi:MAG: MFS transporter, partial [Chloroflexota bacterium]
VQEPWQFYLVIGLVSGAARSALQGVVPGSMIANWFTRRRASAYATAAMGPPIANFLLPPIITFLVATGGWRAAWMGLGGIAVAVGLLPALLIARRIEGTGWLPDGDSPGSAAGAAAAQHDASARGGDWTVGEAVRSPAFWMIAIGMSLILMAPNTSILFLFSYLTSQGLEPHTATLAISMTSGLQVVSRLFFWGPFINRMGSVRWVLVLWGCMLLFSTLVFGLAQEAHWAFAATAVLGCALGGNLVLILQVWPEYFGRRSVGAIIGTAQMIQGVAQAIGPLLLASLLDATGSYSTLYLTMAGLALAGVSLLAKAGRPVRPGARG